MSASCALLLELVSSADVGHWLSQCNHATTLCLLVMGYSSRFLATGRLLACKLYCTLAHTDSTKDKGFMTRRMLDLKMPRQRDFL